MDVTTLFLYISAVSLVMITPGPAMLLALNNGATRGMRVAAWGMAGAALSDLLLIGAVGGGLGALLLASELLFNLAKGAGAAYLLYLAWGMWCAPVRVLCPDPGTATAVGGGCNAFLRALCVGLSNPKGILFFAAFLPQFIRPDEPAAQQYLVLAVISAVVDVVMMSFYALSGRHAMRCFSARVMGWINRSCAGMLGLLAIGLGLYRRSDMS